MFCRKHGGRRGRSSAGCCKAWSSDGTVEDARARAYSKALMAAQRGGRGGRDEYALPLLNECHYAVLVPVYMYTITFEETIVEPLAGKSCPTLHLLRVAGGDLVCNYCERLMPIYETIEKCASNKYNRGAERNKTHALRRPQSTLERDNDQQRQHVAAERPYGWKRE